ncbi:glycosyltransferase [uncultured Sulfitobacter sp.]|uniref:glycosyltransferase family protein n=1 Tax=uncultured Sulfitobacter sp. TaxID=191468 RepID=UPI002606CB7C|nr:glycosyltransferase [uncultured Sulfitobacter sp.]
MKVMIVVTHLLGTGHLARALTLARAYVAAGDTACVVSGGLPAPLMEHSGITFVQLPPVRSDGVDFSRLLNADGTQVTDEHLKIRQRMLLGKFATFSPDVLITELFPFGRRILRDEFQSLLHEAKARPDPPLVCASIRDILAPPSKPKKAIFAEDLIAQFYDIVLVHSDAHVTPLTLSWPVSEILSRKLRYTGFVSPKAAGPHPDGAGAGEILISAGGGDVGEPVYQTAVDAARLLPNPMRILLGGNPSNERIADLRKNAPDHVSVEKARPDFRQMLYHATASVSLCGYNTALDILQAATPAVFIPFDEGSEVEQGIRARALSVQSGITTLARADLNPRSLCDAIEHVINAPRRTTAAKFNGADRTVEITRTLGAKR